ncbi:MAG: DNA primase small subunit domain-containing protein [Candidatus Nitrosocaldus sp.]
MIDHHDDMDGHDVRSYSISLLKQAFKEYYFNYTAMVEVPDAIQEREFGYSRFDGTMVRHLSIRDRNELIALLMVNVPSDVYCSVAYYTSPSRSMEEKGLKAADLIFDIDVKELKPRCSSTHDIHICAECSEPIQEGSSYTATCSRCGSRRINHVIFPCDECISLGKREVKKLVEILVDDFGVDEDNIKVYFSGNYGFHVYVKGRYTMLDAAARLEVVNYILGRGLVDALKKRYGKKRSKEKKRRKRDSKSSSRSSNSSSSRNSMHASIRKGKSDDLNSYGNGSDGSDDVYIPRSIFDGVHGWMGRIGRYLTAGDAHVSMKSIEDAILALSARVDPNVTIDMHRIFRLSGTLNSKSSLAKIQMPRLSDIDSFNPFTDACLISDREVNVYVINAPRFTLKGNQFGPYMHEEVRLPLYTASYLICKGIAYAKQPSKV